MTEDFRTSLFDIISNVAGVQKNKLGAPLTAVELFNEPLENHDIDSITFLEIIMAVEDKFDITLDETDPESYTTFSDVEADMFRQIRAA